MANSALIEDLRKQFAENPRRVFARLANEYRKLGDLDAAIEICRAHVPLQPTYISGYIVLGQALFERGQPDEARATFETALALDPENLIALRQLGDIARVSGDLDAARGWYHKLLEVDPQNDEIAAQLDALDAPQEQSAAAASVTAPAPAAASAMSPTSKEAAPVSWSDIHPDSAPVTPLSPQAMRPRFTIGVIPENVQAPAAERPEPPAAAPAEPPAQELEETMLPEYLAGYDRHAPTPPESAFELTSLDASGFVDIADLAPVDSPVVEGEAASSAPDATAPTAADVAALFADPELESPSVTEPATRTPAESEDDGKSFDEEPYDPTIGRILDLHPRTSSDALLPDLMMTESGAELLREQGHIEQAIYVYRHLAAKNPHDTSYAERIAALERGAHSSIPLVASISDEIVSAARHREYSTQSIRSFFTSFATRRAPDAPAEDSTHSPKPAASTAPPMEPVVPPAEREEAASSLSDVDRSALESLFAANPAVPPSDERAAAALASAFSEEYAPDATAPAGAPTRAASDALSLDAVFQSSRARADGEHRASQPTVSFDEFFAQRENGDTPEGKSDTAIETASPGDDAQSDLELFHEWLDGLKK
jgi:tetratricopeptide (TPR) repeat protein